MPKPKYPPQCQADGCGRAHRTIGYCNMHAHKVRLYGDPFGGPGKGRPPVDLLVRLQRMYVVREDGCWAWTGYLSDEGYAQISISGSGKTARRNGAHKVAYELLVGPVPPGLHLDHVCHTNDPTCLGGPACLHRRCVNPTHLEPVTPKVNVHRALARRVA